MTIAEQFAAELKQEAVSTRKHLERIPEGKLDYAPHVKSMKLGALAVHLADISGWTKETVTLDEFVFDPKDFLPFVPTAASEIVARFDEKLAVALEVLDGVSDERMLANWKMVMGGKVMFDMPRAIVMRTMVLNHSIHHRAQLGVYLRMLDVPVPSAYGPSADEQ